MKPLLFSLAPALTFAACTLVPGKKNEATAPAGPNPRDLKPTEPEFAFNLLAFGDVDLSESTIQGRLGVGGDAKLADYSIGTLLLEDKARCDLAVEGNVDFNRGSLSQGRMCAHGAVQSPDVGWKFPGTADPALDFAALQTSAMTLAERLANLPPDQTVDEKYMNGGKGRIVLASTKPNLNVFSVTTGALELGTGMLIQAPHGSVVVVNVVGTSATVDGLGVVQDGVATEDIVFNAPDLTELALTHAYLAGSVLAPQAALTFNEGKIDGSVVVTSASGDALYNLHPFVGTLPPP